jgi:hypothetical protein
MKRIFFIISFFICIICNSQITLITYSSSVVDNNSSATDPQSSAGPAVQGGDLVIWYAAKRNTTGSITISPNSGETWNAIGTHNGSTATLSANFFWCIVPAGVTVIDPTVTFNATTNNTSVFLVFRPTSSSYTWGLDGNGTNAFTSFAAAATITNNGVTPANASNVSIAFWNTDDDNTWGSLSGTNWSQTSISPVQIRNIAGSDASISVAYQIQTSAAATNNVSQNEATLGNDPGIKSMFTFYEYIPSASVVKPLSLLGVGGKPK